jgi:hypothetical protein
MEKPKAPEGFPPGTPAYFSFLPSATGLAVGPGTVTFFLARRAATGSKRGLMDSDN